MDRDLLSQVLGRRVWPRALTPALLRGYRRRAVSGEHYPVVLPHRGGSVSGVILRRVAAAERELLAGYEGDSYELLCAVAEGSGKAPKQVLFFQSKPGAYTVTSRPWLLASWRLRLKRQGVTHTLGCLPCGEKHLRLAP
jgi:Gamma-glutamyl cyclotransferase, AIG2-like